MKCIGFTIKTASVAWDPTSSDCFPPLCTLGRAVGEVKPEKPTTVINARLMLIRNFVQDVFLIFTFFFFLSAYFVAGHRGVGVGGGGGGCRECRVGKRCGGDTMAIWKAGGRWRANRESRLSSHTHTWSLSVYICVCVDREGLSTLNNLLIKRRCSYGHLIQLCGSVSRLCSQQIISSGNGLRHTQIKCEGQWQMETEWDIISASDHIDTVASKHKYFSFDMNHMTWAFCESSRGWMTSAARDGDRLMQNERKLPDIISLQSTDGKGNGINASPSKWTGRENYLGSSVLHLYFWARALLWLKPPVNLVEKLIWVVSGGQTEAFGWGVSEGKQSLELASDSTVQSNPLHTCHHPPHYTPPTPRVQLDWKHHRCAAIIHDISANGDKVPTCSHPASENEFFCLTYKNQHTHSPSNTVSFDMSYPPCFSIVWGDGWCGDSL